METIIKHGINISKAHHGYLYVDYGYGSNTEVKYKTPRVVP